MKRYVNYISKLAQNKTNEVFSNSGEDHALEVFLQLFGAANNHIRIYAASLCSKVPNDPQYIQAISNFIESGGSVEIILNEYDQEKAINSNLMKRLAYFNSLGRNISLFNTTKIATINDGERVHFAIGDDIMYRFETDINDRTATCNFNDAAFSGVLIAFFNKIKSDEATSEINLQDIFKV